MAENQKIKFQTVDDVKKFTPDKNRLFSATHEEIISGATADVYFVRTNEILNKEGKADTCVTVEIFPSRPGILAGMVECLYLLDGLSLEVWGLEEGESFEAKEPVMRIKGPYSVFGAYETALLGILASSSAWATRARECREAAMDKPFFCFGARHTHPAVAPVMERAAVIGGANGAACILGAKFLDLDPAGTIPHSLVLILCEEALRVAEVLGLDMGAIRLDTPSERGGVTDDLVKEARARLDLAGFNHVQIFVSGGLNPERISQLSAVGADSFGVGSYISSARPIDMTMDIKEIEGKPIAKRGRIPGVIHNPKLKRFL